ncbi:MAG: hypothetical protein ACRDRL_16750, partial [Sciscionella sp.]
ARQHLGPAERGATLMVPVILVDGHAHGEVVHVSETTISYHTEKPRPLPIIGPVDPGPLYESVDYRIELCWLADEEKLLAYPYRFGWSVRKLAGWELIRMIDPDFWWIIRQRAEGAVPITAEQLEQGREACKPPPPPDRHDVDWCRESPGDYACIEGAQYGPCGHECCYGACEWQGDCPCKCHIPERVRTGRPIRMRVNNTPPGTRVSTDG